MAPVLKPVIKNRARLQAQKVSARLDELRKPTPSKSQKRKLKRLQVEKEKEGLLQESMETLEKYKIHEDVYSLMWSSRNLGQVETLREKQRRAFELSKVGLELPERENNLKKRKTCNASRIVELCEEENQLPVVDSCDSVPHTSVLAELSENIYCDNAVISSDGDAIPSENKIVDDFIQPALQETQESSAYLCSNKEEVNNFEHIGDCDQKENKCQENGLGCYPPGELNIRPIVHVSRPADVRKKRLDLPIVMMEQEIMESINERVSVIICGETGCGKTTQVPQFLYEAGFGSSHSNERGGMVGITQPRRVAVLATARRVAFELGLQLGKQVGFQVRHDRRVGESCSMKFMTDGILLRELQSDFLLKRYSVIILDEVHERSVNTDILIGMLSRVIQQRQREYDEQQKRIRSGQLIEDSMRIYPLKLVLMSATLRKEDFVSSNRIFRDPPPVIEVASRQYPVTVHFSRKTEIVDYVGEAFKKVLSIHKRLPPGGILVFVTGQREVEYLCRRLRGATKEKVTAVSKADNEAFTAPEEVTPEDDGLNEILEAFEVHESSCHEITERFSSHKEDSGDFSEDECEMSYSSEEESDLEYFDNNEKSDSKALDVLGANETLDSLRAAFEALSGKKNSDSHTNVSEETEDASAKIIHEQKSFSIGRLRVLPLYAMLPASSQLRVFEEVREGERLVVVATNVAETSLTIPGIKYVVDTGREKVKNYNSSSGIESYEIQWISKASASQRAGRAGRTGPGHCYRLYSSAVFNNLFPDFSKAEILKTPIDSVVLLMKSMHIGKVANFPFPTPPDRNAMIEAENSLKVLGALDENGTLTPLGKAMARFPVSPHLSRMLLTVIHIMQNHAGGDARGNLVLGYAAAAAAALSLSSPFLMHFEESHNAAGDSVQGCEENKKSDDGEGKLSKKKQKLAKKASREKFSNPTSDALSVAFALQCFELSENQAEFCRENSLNYKVMEEMSKLRKQLLHLVFSSNDDTKRGMELAWSHGALSDAESAWNTHADKKSLRISEMNILRRAICAGWCIRVAKRIRAGEMQPQDQEDNKSKVRAARYQALMVKEAVFLHRRSSLSASPPEYLVYSELLHSKRPYIHGATSVEPSWLVQYAPSLCSFSSPLPDPKPFYDCSKDQVLQWVVPSFGQHLWQLPVHPIPIKDRSDRVAVFGSSLLDGEVLPCLKAARKFLAGSPAILLRPESRGLKRVGNLMSGMGAAKGAVIDTCEKLRALWEENGMALFAEIQDWFQEGFRLQFRELWVEMLRQAAMQPKERFSNKRRRDGRGE